MINNVNFSSHVGAFERVQQNHKAIAHAFKRNAERLHNKARGLEPAMDAYLNDRGGVEAVANETALTWLEYAKDITFNNFEHCVNSFVNSCKFAFRRTADEMQRDPRSLPRLLGKRRALDIADEDFAQVEYAEWATDVLACEGVTKENKAFVLERFLSALSERQRNVLIDAKIIATNRERAKNGEATKGRTKLLSASERQLLVRAQSRLRMLKQRALDSSAYAHPMRSEAQLLVDYCEAKVMPELSTKDEAWEIMQRAKERAKLSEAELIELRRKIELSTRIASACWAGHDGRSATHDTSANVGVWMHNRRAYDV